MSRLKILIVDDESYILSILTRKFEQLGYVTVSATDGEEGYAAACTDLPDLVITDLQMPGVSGLEMAARLRANPATRHLPLLMLTSRGHRLSTAELMQTNVQCVLSKPFSTRELVAKVSELTRAGARQTTAGDEPPRHSGGL